MKKPLALILMTLMYVAASAKSDTLVLKPGPSDCYLGGVSFPYPTTVGNKSVNIVTAYWTGNGKSGAWRSYLKFDLSSIPTNATVDSAFLDLYADNASTFGYANKPIYGTDNSSVIRRVTSSWVDSLTLWNNQPSVTSTNEVVLPQTNVLSKDFLHIDVSGMVKDMYQQGNYGFAFKNKNESAYYNSMIFHSPNSTDTNRRPALMVYYRTADTSDTSSGVAQVVPNSNNIMVYPSPAQDHIKVGFRNDVTSTVDIAIYSINGSLLYESKKVLSKVPVTIDLNRFADGTYIIKVMNEDIMETKQFKIVR
ncbi:MAG: T9SS type A sorting domain-containing protein [Chitinophagales bacterium]|nr:T9SS type A sorting domain-containing protein [Chitinophagaceae bacterium]MCB9063808.1 T9SS type A sorting domain-containing protein [Chitinophagales bacterium]